MSVEVTGCMKSRTEIRVTWHIMPYR